MDDDERMRRAEAHEERAMQALDAIRRGGDLGEETLRLSNEYTDGQTARFRAWLRRHAGRFGRSGR